MKFFAVFIVFVLSLHSASAQIKVKAVSSEATELVYVVMALSSESFQMEGVTAEYQTFVKEWFAKFSNHSAIKFMRRNIFKSNYYIDFVLPAFVGVNSTIENGHYHYNDNHYNWSAKHRARFEAEVDKFYHDTNFSNFWQQAQKFYAPALSVFNEKLIPRTNFGWMSEYVPVRGEQNYDVVICLLSGGNNFGSSRGDTPCPVLGVADWVLYSTNIEMQSIYQNVMVHEYLHAYCNPLIDKYLSELSEFGEIIFPTISERSARAKYGKWEIVLYESLVRASLIAYMRAQNYPEQSIAGEASGARAQGIPYVDELGDLLVNEYVSHRNIYPSLESFMPRVVDFYRSKAEQLLLGA